MALQGIDIARNNLFKASNDYAEIQRQLDRYNKIFETYAKASPETQIRAASVMRQAIDEYNGLKKQQEENSLKIYEAQQWVDYYNNNTLPQTQPIEVYSTQNNVVKDVPLDEVRPAPIETIPIISVATPGTLNNNTPITNVELNALDTNTTMNVPINPIFTNLANQNKVSPTIPAGITNYIKNTTPGQSNATIGPVSTSNSTTNKITYGPGTIAQTPGTGGTVGLNTNQSSLGRKWNGISSKGLTYLYNRPR